MDTRKLISYEEYHTKMNNLLKNKTKIEKQIEELRNLPEPEKYDPGKYPNQFPKNGIECPKCGTECVDTCGASCGLGMPIEYSIGCFKCEWHGYRY